MIFDILIIAFLVFMAFAGYKRGLMKTIYSFATTVLAGFLAYLAGKYFAELVYNTFIFSPISDSVKASFSSADTSAFKLSENIFNTIPNYAVSILGGFGVNQRGFANSLKSVSSLSENAVLTTVNKVISPVLITFISIAFIVLLFILIKLLFKFLGRFILKLFKLPIIKSINAGLGSLFGLGEGIIIVFIIIMIVKMLMPISSGSESAKELVDSSILLKTVYYWDFMEFITNISGM